MAYSSALTICGKPAVPSVSDTGVSTSRMLAPGATACAYSTSRVVSEAQSVIPLFFGLNGGILPAGAVTVNLGGGGVRNVLSKVARSALTVGEPNGSTTAIVTPLPVAPRAYRAGRS